MNISNKDLQDIYKAINNVSKKVNEVESKLDEVIHGLNSICNDKILINGDGIDDLGVVISTHDEAIDELASIIGEMEV